MSRSRPFNRVPSRSNPAMNNTSTENGPYNHETLPSVLWSVVDGKSNSQKSQNGRSSETEGDSGSGLNFLLSPTDNELANVAPTVRTMQGDHNNAVSRASYASSFLDALHPGSSPSSRNRRGRAGKGRQTLQSDTFPSPTNRQRGMVREALPSMTFTELELEIANDSAKNSKYKEKSKTNNDDPLPFSPPAANVKFDKKMQEKKKENISVSPIQPNKSGDFRPDVEIESLITSRIPKSTDANELKKNLLALLAARSELVDSSQKHSIRDLEESVDEILSWTFKFGAQCLAWKLSLFYFPKRKISGDTNFVQSLPPLPQHTEELRARVIEALTNPPVPSSPKRSKLKDKAKHNSELYDSLMIIPKQGAAAGNTDFDLDRGEVANLWVHLYDFYVSSKLPVGQEIQLVKQTENSVYYVLQYGLQAFNEKLFNKYGEKLGSNRFTVPHKATNQESIFETLSQRYSDANSLAKDLAKSQKKKHSERNFDKLIEALNFKFREKRKAMEEKVIPLEKEMASFRDKISSPKFPSLRKVSGGLSKVVFRSKAPSKSAHETDFMKKKLKLFLLQCMKTSPDMIDKETAQLASYYDEHGSKALHTRLRIFYGGDFREIDGMTEADIDELLQQGADSGDKGVVRSGNRSESFTNIYKELAFYRKPDVKLRFNKL